MGAVGRRWIDTARFVILGPVLSLRRAHLISSAKGDFRLQRNSKDDDTPHTGRWTMRAIVVTNQAAGMAGMKLVERPEPPAAINDVVVQIHASGFVPTELEWPSTW